MPSNPSLRTTVLTSGRSLRVEALDGSGRPTNFGPLAATPGTSGPCLARGIV